MVDLKSMTLEEMASFFKEMGQPAFRAKQVFQWLHRGAASFEEMTNLPKALQQHLAQTCRLTAPRVERRQESAQDGTIKYLWRLWDGNCIESVPMLHSGYRVGAGDTIILESCEYCNSFLHFFPTVAVVLNVEADHLDFFKDLQDVEHSFRRFAQLVPESGYVVANADDPGAMEALAGLSLFTFGVKRAADSRAENIQWEGGLPAFDVVVRGKPYCHVELQVGGMHNVMNALAAATAAFVLGIPGKAVSEGLASFTGAGRRFEYKGAYHGAKIYDDYAHHPGELHALFQMARSLGYQRIICAFQPHTYSRTKALFDDFVRELRAADVVLLAEIYAAREKNTIGISSKDLAGELPGAIYCPTLADVTRHLRELARDGDLIVTVGAGNIYTAGEALLR